MALEKIGLEAIFKTDAFKKGMKQYNDGLKTSEGATSKFASSAQVLGKLGGVFAAAGAGVGVVVGAFKALQKAIEPTVAYAKQVRDLGRAIGASAEESSKLIQVADDVEVSYETLKQGLIAAVRKGIDPSVESISRLSEEYRKLQPGLERTKFLVDRFGRSGADLAPLMELGSQAIKDMGSEAEKLGLVLDEKGVQAARDYEIAIDNLEDSLQGLKTGIAMDVIPVLNRLIDGLVTTLNYTRNLDQLYKGHEAEMRSVAATYDEYVTEMLRVAVATGQATEGEVNFILALEEVDRRANLTDESLDLLSEAQFLLGKQSDAIKAQQDDLNSRIMGTAGAADAAAEAIGRVATAILDMTAKAFATKAIESAGKMFEAGALSGAEYYGIINDIGTAYMGWTPTQIAASTAMTIYNSRIDKAIESGALLEERAQAYIGYQKDLIALVDKNTEAQAGYDKVYKDYLSAQQDGIATLEEQARKLEDFRQVVEDTDRDIDSMAESLTGVPKTIPIDMDKIKEDTDYAARKAAALKGYLEGIPPYVYSLVVTEYKAKGGGGGGGYAFGQSGGAFPGGQPVVVGENRPEVVVSQGGMQVFPSISDFQRAMSGAGGTTNNFNLNMNAGSLNPQVVRQSFEMMRLLNNGR